MKGERVALVERLPLSTGRVRAMFYAIGFDDGRVKFGKSHNPRSRLRRICKVDACQPVWAHLFGLVRSSHVGKPCAAEEALWAIAQQNGARRLGRSEYFTGVSREQAIQFGRMARTAEQPA